MIKGTHETFQDKTKTHGIVDTKELWHSMGLQPIVIMNLMVYFSEADIYHPTLLRSDTVDREI